MAFDVIIIGSGFGGAITACRLTEAGMKVLVLERGRRWEPKAGPGVTAYPQNLTDPWIWDQNHPELFNGWTDVRNFGADAVSRTVIQLAKDLGLEVVAEGVETADQRDILLAMGCYSAQGWYYGAAGPSEALFQPLPVSVPLPRQASPDEDEAVLRTSM